MSNKKDRTKPKEEWVGRDIARVWALTFGSAWVTKDELFDPPSPLAFSYTTFSKLLLLVQRAGVPFEKRKMWVKDNNHMYRLTPETVKELTYGGTNDGRD